MLVGVFVVLSLVAVPLLGGSLPRLADLHLRAPWLLPLALTAQVIVISVVPDGPPVVLPAIHIVSYLLAGTSSFSTAAFRGLV
jgi:hypothetical protein